MSKTTASPAAPVVPGEEIARDIAAFLKLRDEEVTDPDERTDEERAESALAILDIIRPAFDAKDRQVRELALLLDKQMGTPCEQIRHQQEVEALQAKLAQAGEAMEPFAGYYGPHYPDTDDRGVPLPDEDGTGWVYLTVGDFRRARSAASDIRGEKT
ncbi:hypothetical protein OIU35_31445 [Boseaceae bacterium BT-24-1]|nr:hypothetical protein [Boseaceae bacterium BT-24-1]